MGAVRDAACRSVAAVYGFFVTNTWLDTKLLHDPLRSVFAHTERKRDASVAICRMFRECVEDTIPELDIFQLLFGFVVEGGTRDAERAGKGNL